MARDQFALLFRSLTRAPSRRVALRALASVIAGDLLIRQDRGDTVARRDPDKKCPPCRKKKNGQCNKTKKPDGTPCGTDKICISGKCRIDPNL
jgi:hypothetical protein